VTSGLPPLIFLACKYTEPHTYQIARNIHWATWYAHEIALLGGAPLCPALIGSHFEGTQSYLWWGDAYINLLRRCDAVFMVPGYERSNGAMKELTEALAIGLPVFFDLKELGEWLSENSHDPNYVSPSPSTLALLRAGIDSAKSGDVVYRDEDFSQYTEDE
jgi:hypothetical protein